MRDALPPAREEPVRYRLKRSPLSSHQRLLGAVPAGSRVLDVGTEPFLLPSLQAKGCRVVGISQRMPEPADAALYERVLVCDLDRDPLPPPEEMGCFDRVLMGDLLEHLRAPAGAVAAARPLLAPAGMLVVSTANVAHFTVRFLLLLGRFDYYRRGILDDTHLRFFTRRTIRRLLLDGGFEVLETRATPIPFELVVGSGRAAGRLGRLLERAYYPLAVLWPGLFAYQFVLLCRPASSAPGA